MKWRQWHIGLMVLMLIATFPLAATAQAQAPAGSVVFVPRLHVRFLVPAGTSTIERTNDPGDNDSCAVFTGTNGSSRRIQICVSPSTTSIQNDKAWWQAEAIVLQGRESFGEDGPASYKVNGTFGYISGFGYGLSDDSMMANQLYLADAGNNRVSILYQAVGHAQSDIYHGLTGFWEVVLPSVDFFAV